MSMILFQEDWIENPQAVIHASTKNTSFLRYSALLKQMGVKNHLFPLQLHDVDLLEVDPHAADITTENMLRVALECRRNFYYYLREVFLSPDGNEDDPIRFHAHRGNMALFWLYFNHIETILIQIRQTGKSFAVDTLDNYLLNIRCKKTTINLLTKDDILRSANLNRLRRIEGELPFYLKQRTRNDIGNTEEMTVKSLENAYRGHLPNKSEKLALNVGRGLTSGNFRVDELAFFANIAISLPAALAAGTAARDIAKRAGEPYGVIMTTTAGKKDDRDGAYAFNLMMEAAVWTENFFDCINEEDLKTVIIKASPADELRVNCSFNHLQLGYTNQWLREAIKQAKATGDAAERDFLNHWTSGGISSPLPVEINNMIRNSQKGDYYSDIARPYAYVTRWYVPKDRVEQQMAASHILSVDTSDAVGRDDIGLKVRCVKSGDVIAVGNYNEINLITFAEWLCWWLETYPKLTLIIERRSSGATILDYLLLMLPKRGIDPFKRIYNRVVQDAAEKPDAFKEINQPLHMRREDIYIRYKSYFGFATSATGATSRTDLYSNTLQRAAHLTGAAVNDKVLIEQILSLEVRNGRVDHKAGKHDDLVIAWLLSFWLISKGQNLIHYGINPREILVNNQAHGVENDPVSRYQAMEQVYIRGQIDQLTEEIKKEKDDFVADRLETKLRGLIGRLVNQQGSSNSTDELIANLREFRKINRRIRPVSYYR